MSIPIRSIMRIFNPKFHNPVQLFLKFPFELLQFADINVLFIHFSGSAQQ
jgi:hypothetical protein